MAPFNDAAEDKSFNSIEEIKDDPDHLMPSEANVQADRNNNQFADFMDFGNDFAEPNAQ